jgi:hypothetical protein
VACQSKYILKTIIDLNLGYISRSICTIMSIANDKNGEVNDINVIFDGDIDSAEMCNRVDYRIDYIVDYHVDYIIDYVIVIG